MTRLMHWRTEAETLAAGRRLGETLGEGASGALRLGLEGTLGAGKTTFVRGVASGMRSGLEVEVNSPTYALWQTYGEGALHHLDLYRLAGEEDLETLGFLDVWVSGVWIVEWASRVDSILQALDLVLVIEVQGTSRRVEVISLTARGDAVASSLM